MLIFFAVLNALISFSIAFSCGFMLYYRSKHHDENNLARSIYKYEPLFVVGVLLGIIQMGIIIIFVALIAAATTKTYRMLDNHINNFTRNE